MVDDTEEIRRELIANQQPSEREGLEFRFGKVWDTQQLTEEFEVIGFLAPFVVVKNRKTGKKGSLEFQHSPRYYYSYKED